MKQLNGIYYFFECGNAFISGKLFPAAGFDDDSDAAGFAADYEATAYRITYKNGAPVDTAKIYDPQEAGRE